MDLRRARQTPVARHFFRGNVWLAHLRQGGHAGLVPIFVAARTGCPIAYPFEFLLLRTAAGGGSGNTDGRPCERPLPASRRIAGQGLRVVPLCGGLPSEGLPR